MAKFIYGFGLAPVMKYRVRIQRYDPADGKYREIEGFTFETRIRIEAVIKVFRNLVDLMASLDTAFREVEEIAEAS